MNKRKTKTKMNTSLSPLDRENLGRIVREVWVDYCLDHNDHNANNVRSWEHLSEYDREVDRLIGEKIKRVVIKEIETKYRSKCQDVIKQIEILNMQIKKLELDVLEIKAKEK